MICTRRSSQPNPAILTGGPDWLDPGTTLRIPTGPDTAATGDAKVKEAAVKEVEVKEGDTLSGLAEQHLKDPEQWPQIYQASKNIHQPNGSHLTDPDLIYPGWHLHIPETSSQHTVTDVTDDTVSPEPGGSAPVGKETARRVTDLGSHLGPAATERSPARGTPATLDTSRPAAQAQPGGSAPPARDAGKASRLGHLPLSLTLRVTRIGCSPGSWAAAPSLAVACSWPWPTGAGHSSATAAPGTPSPPPSRDWPLSKGP